MRRVEFTFRETANLNTEKDYYNDLPGKLPPELLQNSELPKKVSQLTIQKPRERLSSNLIDLSSPPPDPDYVNDKSFDENSNTTPPAITRDVFDMRKYAIEQKLFPSLLLFQGVLRVFMHYSAY